MVCFNYYYLKPYLLLIMPCIDKHLQPVGGGGGLAGVGGREIEIGLVATLKKYSKGGPSHSNLIVVRPLQRRLSRDMLLAVDPPRLCFKRTSVGVFISTQLPIVTNSARFCYATRICLTNVFMAEYNPDIPQA
jgi:hypothetical protein